MNNPLKFCMVTTFYPPYNFGGDGIYVHRLSNELARRGHRVDVFHCGDAFELLQKAAVNGEYQNHPNVKVTRLNSRMKFLSPLLTQQTGVPFFKGELKRRMEEDYDVIHFHNMSLIGITALGYGSAKAIKLYTMHEHWLVCPMHILWKYDREVCSEKSCFTCQLAGNRPPQLWRYSGLIEKMTKHVDCFISPSRFSLKMHGKMGLNAPIEHIPNFLTASDGETVESDEIRRTKAKSERPYFLFVGRLEKIKGLQEVIPIFKKRPEYDLLIVGDGAYRETLENKAAGSPNIKFLGRLEQNRLKNLYRAAVATIVPSICYETFGIVIIESFAAKTPVIVNNLGALPEMVNESGGGIIYNNRGEMADAVKKLAADAPLRKELGEKGFEAFLKYWNEEAHLKRYFDLIHTISKNKSSDANKSFNPNLSFD